MRGGVRCSRLWELDQPILIRNPDQYDLSVGQGENDRRRTSKYLRQILAPISPPFLAAQGE